jgi:hypothetical protein
MGKHRWLGPWLVTFELVPLLFGLDSILASWEMVDRILSQLMRPAHSLVQSVWSGIGVNRSLAWGIPQVDLKIGESHFVSLMIHGMIHST